MDTPDTVTAGVVEAVRTAVLDTAKKHGGQPPFGLAIIASMSMKVEFAVIPDFRAIKPTVEAAVSRIPDAFLAVIAFPYRTRRLKEDRLALIVARVDQILCATSFRIDLSPVNPALHEVGALEPYLVPNLSSVWGAGPNVRQVLQ